MNKLDLIIETIEFSKLVDNQVHRDELIDDALEDLRELRDLYTPTTVSADNSIKTVMSTKQQNIDTSGQCTHKSDESIHESVAYVTGYYNGRCVIAPLDPAWLIPAGTAFYRAPQRKKWVGLTDDEVKDILDCGRGGLIDIKKTEAKLKSKNETP